jgi:hypothetical protein
MHTAGAGATRSGPCFTKRSAEVVSAVRVRLAARRFRLDAKTEEVLISVKSQLDSILSPDQKTVTRPLRALIGLRELDVQ